ncbi:hypothetical protein GGS26DRAFT_571343 [Hypomontagnella submonticulosa]|nr:hypothetical protein GGS26DRAFT_571343 [Hypomontagnella submonticulosa]
MDNFSSFTPPKEGAADITYESWEDPHPGERLQIPLGVSSGLHIYQTISGDAVGGVAVKARSAYQASGSWMMGRSVRSRHRSTKPKPLKIPARVAEEPEAKNAPVAAPPCGFLAPPLHLLPLPETFRPLDFETDTETEAGAEVGTLVGDAEPDYVKLTVSQTHLSDYSNYLGVSNGEETDDASVTVVDPDGFARTNSVDDTYGWEAELDRKMSCRVSTDSVCPYHHLRSVDGSKRGLLHRVFSVSGRRMNTEF